MAKGVGKGNRSNTYCYLTALNYRDAESTFELVDVVESNEDDITSDDRGVVITSKQLSPEEVIIERQTFEQLSREARELISFILNAPEQCLELLKTPSGKSNKISIRQIRRLLTNSHRSKNVSRANRIISEVRLWLKSLK